MRARHRRWGSGGEGAWVLALAGACACALPAQGTGERTVEVRVTSVAGDSVYLNHGRDIGLSVGDRVLLFPAAGEVEVTVRSLSHSSARAQVLPGSAVPPVGTRGEATVPEAAQSERSGRTGRTGRTGRKVPPHPPWQRQIGERADNQPLLVPTFSQRPDQRPMTIDGRLFALGQWNRDLDSGGGDYLLMRTGLRSDVNNALGFGERLRIAGEFSSRRVLLQDVPDQVDERLRLDLASAAFGEEAYSPYGLEVGRFLSRYLPEIGLLDGVEGVARFEGGVRVGAGMGAYPRPFPARNSGDDVGVHAFVDYTADARRSLAAALGVQKTWHLGAPDRDLLVLRGEWRPARAWSFLGNAKVDFYSGSDSLKRSSVELTELMVQARWRARSFGFGATGSHFSWPQLKRFEYQFLSADLVRNGRVDRASLSGWWNASRDVSVRVRGDVFADQNTTGNSLRVDTTVRRLYGDASALTVSLFRNDGSYTSGPGAYLAWRDKIGAGRWTLAYRFYRYTIGGLIGGDETMVRQSASLRLAMPLGERTDLDISGERWFGDGQDAFTLGFFVQWRF